MSDISKISINDETYNIKDAFARQQNIDLKGELGSLAYKNEATGTFTPSGTVTAPIVEITPTTKSVKTVTNNGELPTWSANVSEETLSFNFNSGSLPTTANQTVVTSIADVEVTAPLFNGTLGNINVS